LALAVVLAVTSSASAAARQSAQLEASYEAAVVAFQTAGDTAQAHRLVASWTHQQFETAVARSRRESPQLGRPASLLHLEIALALVETDPDEALWQIRLGEQLLESLARAQPAPTEDFVARWSVVASSVFQARTDVPRARAALAFGLASRPRDARVRQHAGTIEDLASLVAENDDTGLADRKGTEARRLTLRLIGRAEREYRESLAIAPDYAPARIRLGRLLHRRDRLQDARAELERARAGVLPTGERYLLLLFLSATYEALKEPALARAALQEGVRVAGNQQGAWLALAQFEERSGHPERARGVIAQGLVHGRRSDTDAWWDYRHGGFDSEGLTWLRRIAGFLR
jgi:tetratricopeptide (TPR) repeat protein